MKKKTEKDFIKWIEKQVKYYSPFLGIQLQQIKAKLVSEKEGSYLSIGLTYPYLDSTILFSCGALEDFKKGTVQKDRILHELCHTITDPLYVKSVYRYVGKNEIEDERERLTDILTAIIRNLLPQ